MTVENSLDPAADRIVYRMMFLGLLPAIIVGGLAMVIDFKAGLVALVAVQIVWVLVVIIRTRGAIDQVLRSIGGRPLREGEYPQLENLLHGLGLTGGVRMPDVRLLETPSMNAMMVADSDDATLVITTGLIEGLDRIELEGVLANLLARRRDGSARYATMVTSMYGNSGAGGGAKMLMAGLGDQRSIRSDLAAIDMTLYPPGLAGALEKMERKGTFIADAPTETLHLWLAPAVPVESALKNLDESLVTSTMQPLGLRRAVLDEL